MSGKKPVRIIAWHVKRTDGLSVGPSAKLGSMAREIALGADSQIKIIGGTQCWA